MQKQSPPTQNLQEPNREDYQNKEKTQLLKESVISVTSPSLIKAWVIHFTIEVQITSPSMDMNLCFNKYYLLWSGGLLPHEPGRKQN
jgi:hypothetical protein